MVKYKFSNKTMFAIVMRDEELCREFTERVCIAKQTEASFVQKEVAQQSCDGGIAAKNCD